MLSRIIARNSPKSAIADQGAGRTSAGQNIRGLPLNHLQAHCSHDSLKTTTFLFNIPFGWCCFNGGGLGSPHCICPLKITSLQTRKCLRQCSLAFPPGYNRKGLASALRHTDRLLLRLALARLTFSRMSLAFAVQIKGLGWRLCFWI